MLVRFVHRIGHLRALDVGPEDNGKEVERSDQTEHDLQDDHSSVHVKVLHAARNGNRIEKVGSQNSTPKPIRLDQFVFHDIKMNDNRIQARRITSSLIVDVQSFTNFEKFKPEVVGNIGEQQGQKANDAAEEIRKVHHLNAFRN